MEPVWLRLCAGRRIVPDTIGDGMWVCAKITTNVRGDIATAGTPRAGIRVEPVIDCALRVVPFGIAPIIVEPIIHLNGTYTRHSTPIALLLIPVCCGSVHPGCIRAKEFFAAIGAVRCACC